MFFISTRVPAYSFVDNVSRADWTRTEISTGENHGVQIGRFSDEALQRRTFKGKFRIFEYDQALSRVTEPSFTILKRRKPDPRFPYQRWRSMLPEQRLQLYHNGRRSEYRAERDRFASGLDGQPNDRSHIRHAHDRGKLFGRLSAETSASTDVKTLTINLPVWLLSSRSMIQVWFMLRLRGLLVRFLRRDAPPFPALRYLKRRDRNLAKLENLGNKLVRPFLKDLTG